MLIVITTFMREENQKAIKQIPTSLHEKVRLFTREDRVSELRKHVPENIQIIANPMDIDGIADIRQRCIDALPKGKVWVMDDLCTFGRRDPENPTKTIGKLTEEEFAELYNIVEKELDTYIQVGFSPRGGNNQFEGTRKVIGRCYTTYGLRTDLMDEHNIKFDGMYQKNKEIKLYEDYYITLSMLTKGLENVVIYDWFFNYTHNVKGGNSTFRTLDLQEKACFELKKHFPEFVEVIDKEGDWGSQGMSSRKEPRISWKASFNAYNQSGDLSDWF